MNWTLSAAWRLVIVVFVLAGVSTCGVAAEYPKRTVIAQRGKKVPCYMLGGLLYREASARSALRVEPKIKLALVVKLMDVNGRRVAVHGTEYADFIFELAPGVVLPSRVQGTNLLLGVTRKTADGLAFVVRHAALLPDDLTIFQERLARLEAVQDTPPEAYLGLADWLDQLKGQADQALFDKYAKACDALRERALALDEKGLAAESGPMTERVKRVDAYIEDVGETPPSRGAAILAAAYRQWLQDSPEAVATARAGGALSPAQSARLCATALLQIGDLRRALLGDLPTVEKAYLLKAAKVDPSLPKVKAKLPRMGYVLYEGRWLTKAEARRAEREARAAAAAAATDREKPRPDSGARAAELAGKGFENSRLIAELLLGEKGGSSLNELAESLNEMPLDVARQSVFQAYAWYGETEAGLAFLQAVLAGEPVALRSDAAAWLALSGRPEAVSLLLARLEKESDETLLKALVDALWQTPGGLGVGGAVEVLQRKGLPLTVRERAAALLAEETGKSYGVDGFPWKRWWDKVRDGYQRKPLPGTPESAR